MASAGTNGSAGNSIGTDGAVRAAGDFGRGCRDVRCKRKAGSKEEKSGKSPIAEDVRSPIAAAQVRFVDAERELIEEAAAGLVANVETGVAFFGEDILPVLRDDNVARVRGRSVIDGMGVDVGSLERNATMEAAQEAHDQRIVFGEGSGVFRVEVGARERERVDETGGADHVKARAFGAGVTEIENESERKSALCVEVPALNVRQAVVLVDGVVAKVRGVAETVVQRVEREIVGNVAVGLDIGEGRLISQILDEAAVLDHAVIDGVAGAYDGFLRSVPSQADMGRKVVAVRIDETARIFLAADGTDLVGLDRGDVRKAGVIVEGGEAIVFFDEGREVVVAETEAEGEVGKDAPIVAGEKIPVGFASVRGLIGRFDFGFLRQTEKKIREGRAGRSEGIAAGDTRRFSVGAGKDVATGGVRGATEEIELHATKIAAKTKDVAAVGPGTGTGEAEDLGQLKIGLGFGHSGEVVEDEIGQAEVECVGIDGNAVAVSGGRGEEAELGGDVLLAGEVVADLRIVAAFGDVDVGNPLAFGGGVTGGERITLDALLAAEAGKDVDDVGGDVPVVEVDVEALRERRGAGDLAEARVIRIRKPTEVVRVAGADGVGVRALRGEETVVEAAALQIGFGNVLEKHDGGRVERRVDGVVGIGNGAARRIDWDELALLVEELGEVAFALEFSGHDAVLADDGGGALSCVAEKNGVARTRFGEAGDERLAADGDAVAVALVFRIGRRLAG